MNKEDTNKCYYSKCIINMMWVMMRMIWMNKSKYNK